MKRMIEDQLLAWKSSTRRKPLLVRGARQVGKTYSIEAFGNQHFSSAVTVDLERNPGFHRIFEPDLDPSRVLAEIEILRNSRIVPGEALLFLDEIQACPRAIQALRYFHEEMPELHVIAAGSLLEFALGDLPFPVGRIQFLEMHPLCFAEYLLASGHERAAEVVLSSPRPVGQTTHDFLLSELRKYLFSGGMPEAVRVFVESGSLADGISVHAELCHAYRQDFAKYRPRVNPACLEAVLTGIAQRVGQPIIYNRLADGFSPPTKKKAFETLCRARIARRIPSASPAGLPLGASASPKRMKAILVDTGLWQYLCGMRVEVEFARADLLSIYRGAMAEHFVGQELAVSQGSELHCWMRKARSSSAEVDYLVQVKGEVVPIEVKGAPAGRLRSMHRLLQDYPSCQQGLVLSTAPYAELPEQKLLFLPLYFAYSATKVVQ